MPRLKFLERPGEMAARIRSHDWREHPLGPPERWPDALRTALDIALGSSFPTAIYWGPDLHLLYNDAWAPIPAERHPWALGRPGQEVWTDIWEIVGEQFADVLAGKAIATFDQMLPIVRDGEARESYWNYSLSPIRDDAGQVVGVFNQGSETTRAVLAERASRSESERLRELFQQAPGAIALLRGPEFVYEFANALYHQLAQQRPLIGLPLREALPDVAASGFVEILQRVWATGEPYRADAAPVSLWQPHGAPPETILLDFVCQPIRDATGTITHIFVQANDVTARARTERALRRSEERLQLALDSSSSIGVWDWDVVNDRVTADARFARLYGVDEDLAATGAPVADFFRNIHPDDVPRVQQAIEATLTTGHLFAEEYRLIQPNGSIRWAAAQGRAQFGRDGKPTRLPGVSFDVTKRRQAEEAARVASDDLRIANETQAFVYRLAERLRRQDGVAAIMRRTTAELGQRLGADRVGFYRVVDDELVFEACWTNGRLEPVTGRARVDELGNRVLASYRAGNAVIAADTAGSDELHASLIGRLAPAAIGVPLLHDDRWAATLYVNQAQPRRWNAEEIALVETVAEIAWNAVERAGAVSDLAASEEKFRAIANSIDVMVWSTLPDGFHDYYNDRWYAFTGVPDGSTDGEGWNDMFHPDDRDRARALWHHCLTTGDHYRIEYRLRHRSGQYRWVLGTAQPTHDADGRIVRWFGTCTDIQEIVEAREVIARSRAELEQAVMDRTRQLMQAEEQLRQSQKMEAVGQLTGGIAHDFNNMLAVVIGALDLMDRRIAQGRSDIARYLDAARDGATRAAALTQRLLSFSRQTPLAPATVDVNALVDGMGDLLARSIGESVQIAHHLAPELWLATTDASQLENAIVNLSVNARDAMPRGGHLKIATDNMAVEEPSAAGFGIAAGDYIAVTVTDTGSGMTPDVAAKAFDPFFTTKSVGKGTGLGLSQVFGFVRQSGGHVLLDTEPGAGTSVRMLLPRAAAGSTPTPTPRLTQTAIPRGRPDELVLVVEDDERVRNFSVEALRELGYTVIHADGGREALAELARHGTVSLLFTDVVMPEMTGRELAQAARADLPELRILYTSGYTRDVVDERTAGGAALLAKPFDIATLALRVRAALDAPPGTV